VTLASERENIEDEAGRWVAREDRGLSLVEMAARDAWLDGDTAHRLAYLRLKSVWERTERLAALRQSPAEEASWLVRHRALAAAAAMLAVLAAGAGIYLHMRNLSAETYVARGAARPILHLADGTRIQLNTDTQVRTDVTTAHRTVMLEHGEAYFDVVHDARRPFVVIAGNRRITDLGTKFSVRRDGDDVKVIVKEGRVRVDIVDTGQPAAPVFAVGGNVVVAKSDETLIANASAKELDDQLNWRTDMLEFHQETLADAAAEFNRYNQRQIAVEGAARDIRIGGRFRADNVDVFVLLVRNALGLKVQEDANKITIAQ